MRSGTWNCPGTEINAWFAMLTRIVATNVRGESVSADVREERVLASVYRILEDSVLCSMATVTSHNRAHINIAYVAHTDDLRLCFLSHPSARHCHNLLTNPSMAISVFRSTQDWTGPDRGLQLFGSCHMATPDESASASQVYGRRFAQYEKWAASLPERAPGREYHFFWFDAEELKLLDEREFGEAVFVTAEVQRQAREPRCAV